MEIKKAVIAAPPVRDFYFTPGRASALGAESVLSQLKKLGIETDLLNFPLHNPRGSSTEIPHEYDYLRPFLMAGERGPLSFFSKGKLYGPRFKDAAEEILSRDPQIIFISLFAFTYGDDAIELAREIRKQSGSSIPLILGGAGASVLPDYFTRNDLFDRVLCGEAEVVIPALIEHIRNENPLNDFQEILELIEHPSPLFSFHRDSKGGQWLTLALSRGCPKKCRFCSNFLTQGRRFRMVDLKELEKGLSDLPIHRNQPLHINLEDDNLLFHKNYLEDFLKLMDQSFPQGTCSIDNGLDYTLLDEEYLDFLIAQGFSHFSLSLGSADENILKKERRPGNLIKLENLLDHLKLRGIPSTTFFIAGLPNDTVRSVMANLIYLHGLPTESGISPFYPVPGIPRFEDKELFLTKPAFLCSGSSAYPWAGSLSTAQMVTAFRLSRFSNLLKKEGKEEHERELIKRIKSTGRLQTFIGKAGKITPVPHMEAEMVERFLSHIN